MAIEKQMQLNGRNKANTSDGQGAEARPRSKEASQGKFRKLERRALMSDNVIVQFVGFEVKALVRE